MNFVDYTTVIRDLLIDFTSLYFVAYVVLYRRYHNVEMFVSCTLFNIFILLIVMALIRTEFNIAVGFGLFALLSLIQLRSAQFTKTEMAYLFGAVALAVVNGAGIIDFRFLLICNVVIVSSTWFISTWSLEHSANLIKVDNLCKIAVTLDQVDELAIGDRILMRKQLAEKLGMDVCYFKIKKLDYVRDIIVLAVIHRLPVDEIPNYHDNFELEPAQEDGLESHA